MASLFEKGFNKFADMGNALNKEANKLVGKEVFGEIKKIEEPKVFHHLKAIHLVLLKNPNNGLLLQEIASSLSWMEI